MSQQIQLPTPASSLTHKLGTTKFRSDRGQPLWPWNSLLEYFKNQRDKEIPSTSPLPCHLPTEEKPGWETQRRNRGWAARAGGAGPRAKEGLWHILGECAPLPPLAAPWGRRRQWGELRRDGREQGQREANGEAPPLAASSTAGPADPEGTPRPARLPHTTRAFSRWLWGFRPREGPVGAKWYRPQVIAVRGRRELSGKLLHIFTLKRRLP